MKRPDWKGADSFAEAWACLAGEGWTEQLRQMQEARVIAFPREQVEALPPIGTFDSARYVEERWGVVWEALFESVRPPFPTCFLDLGRASIALAAPGDAETRVAGGLVTTGESGSPVVLPFRQVEGRVLASYSSEQAADDGAITAAACAERVAASLALLEAANVELVEAPLSRRDRRRLRKRPRPVALSVQIRAPRGGYSGRGGESHYSHRFEVRGHYLHTTRGSSAKPEHLRPCPYWEQRHPHSRECRRIWQPPHVKGPAGGVLVPKLRALVKPQPSPSEDAP